MIFGEVSVALFLNRGPLAKGLDGYSCKVEEFTGESSTNLRAFIAVIWTTARRISQKFGCFFI